MTRSDYEKAVTKVRYRFRENKSNKSDRIFAYHMAHNAENHACLLLERYLEKDLGVA